MCLYRMKKPMLPVKIKAYSYHQESFIRWRPSVREGALMTHIATSYDEHRLYLYSGLSNIALNEIVEMYIQDENGEVSWDPQLVQVNTKSHRSSNKHEKATFNDPTLKRGRFGATVISYNEQDPYNSQVKRQVIYYYGGGQMYNEQIQQRE